MIFLYSDISIFVHIFYKINGNGWIEEDIMEDQPYIDFNDPRQKKVNSKVTDVGVPSDIETP